MANAQKRNMVQAPAQVTSIASLDDATRLIQQLADAVHELNARIYFLQEQLAIVATDAGSTIETLEDY